MARWNAGEQSKPSIFWTVLDVFTVMAPACRANSGHTTSLAGCVGRPLSCPADASAAAAITAVALALSP